MLNKIQNWFKQIKKPIPVNIYRVTLTSKIQFNTIFDVENHIIQELTMVWEISEVTVPLYSYYDRSFTQKEAEENLIYSWMRPITINERAVTIKKPHDPYYIERSAIYLWKFWETEKVELIGNHIELGYHRKHEKLVSTK